MCVEGEGLEELSVGVLAGCKGPVPCDIIVLLPQAYKSRSIRAYTTNSFPIDTHPSPFQTSARPT